MCSLYKLSIIFFLVSSCHAINNTVDVIGFPEVEENPGLKNKENRQPVFIPAMCSVNEWYYPGDQKDDWICDCKPAHLYHPGSDKCWPAYRQGPCSPGFYLVLPQNSMVPVCEKNPCNIDFYVLWNGKCERLGSPGPCNFINNPVPATLDVNATSLVVSCVRLSFTSRIAIDEPERICPPGCKRSIAGSCVPLTY